MTQLLTTQYMGDNLICYHHLKEVISRKRHRSLTKDPWCILRLSVWMQWLKKAWQECGSSARWQGCGRARWQGCGRAKWWQIGGNAANVIMAANLSTSNMTTVLEARDKGLADVSRLMWAFSVVVFPAQIFSPLMEFVNQHFAFTCESQGLVPSVPMLHAA